MKLGNALLTYGSDDAVSFLVLRDTCLPSESMGMKSPMIAEDELERSCSLALEADAEPDAQ